jgi:hypothetical protein
MGFLDRLRFFRRTPTQQPADSFLPDLPLRREAATRMVTESTLELRRQTEDIGPTLPFNMGIDSDEYTYRRLTGNAKGQRRDLAPVAQDRMIEIAYYLWEQNALAKRLITLMTDLIIGEGVSVEAMDQRNQEVVTLTWNHRENKLKERIRAFHNALCLNGELILPVATNPINGVPRLGFIDPYQVATVQTLPDNVLVPDILVLKPSTATGGTDGQQLKIIRENPETGRLEGEVFFFSINTLPNGLRGRSDLNALADWLDLYDQYLFGEVERLHLLSSFVWDYQIEGADDKKIQEKLRAFPKPKPGEVFAHNEKEKLEAQTPDLKAQDRSEVSRILRVHIAGSMGYPLSYLGDIDSNRATIEGQNDIVMKTPAARQKEFAAFIDQIVRFSIESAQATSPALFRDVNQGYKIVMPEISAKDISRAGATLAQVMSGMDTALNNKTMSKRAAILIQTAIVKHLGVVLDPVDMQKEIDEEGEEAQAKADELQTAVAAARAKDALAAARNPNPPIPEDPELDEGPEDAAMN